MKYVLRGLTAVLKRIQKSKVKKGRVGDFEILLVLKEGDF